MNKIGNSIASLLGLRDSTSDAEDDLIRPRATAEDHRNAHVWGIRLTQGRIRGRSEGQLARKQRRIRQADLRSQTKKATRNHRRGIIGALQNESTVLGLARVYIGGAGGVEMQRNVARHVDALARELAKQKHPSLWTDDTLSPEDFHRQIDAAVLEAEGLIHDRLQGALDRAAA